MTAEPWKTWISTGILEKTTGNTTDIEYIYRYLETLIEAYAVQRLAADPSNCIEFLTRCVNHYGIPTLEFKQNCGWYNNPTRYFLQALHEGRISHGGHELLGWAADNCTVKEDSVGYVMPSKKRSADKIDPLVATIMGIAAATDLSQPRYDFYVTNQLEIG